LLLILFQSHLNIFEDINLVYFKKLNIFIYLLKTFILELYHQLNG